MSSLGSSRLAVLGAAPPQPAATGRAARLAEVRAQLALLGEAAARERFGLQPGEVALKTTASLCPTCLDYVPAVVFRREDSVWMRKDCAVHALSEALLERDERYYFLSNKDNCGRRFAEDRLMYIPQFDGGCCSSEDDCGPAPSLGTDQAANKTCTVLVEVTDACNLACAVCYSESDGERFLPLETFKKHISALLQQKGSLDSVQVTGGEASLHPGFWELVDFLYRQETIKKIYLPTNGILLSREEEADKAAPYADKAMVLLQFDAVSDEPNQAIRNADTRTVRERVLEHMQRLGVPVQLTMTLSARVNDDEIGEVIDIGLRHSCVKVIALQPVTWSGRYDLDRDPADRLTLSDVARAVHEQARLRMQEEDFVPIPCSHPNCGWITVFARRFGITHNVVRYIDMPRVLDKVAYKTMMSTGELREMVSEGPQSGVRKLAAKLLGPLIRSQDTFTIAIKPFMDRYTYDQDRIANCCHHITDTGGQLVSFCEYNALLRREDPWQHLPTLQQLEAPAAARRPQG